MKEQAPIAHPQDSAGHMAQFGDSGMHRRWVNIVLIMAGLFFVKAVVFAWMVTPLWDTPDETGHYSYIESLANGHYPVLGKAVMGADVTSSWLGKGVKQPLNWIAQHPPFYYALGTPVLMAARAAGLSFDQQVRSTRMLSALFGAGTLFGLAIFIARVTNSRGLGLAAAIFVGATPMFLHLSSGVTHDTLLACLGAWSAERYSCWVAGRDSKHAYACAAFLALGCITKITALAAAVPLVALIFLQFLRTRKSWRERLSHIVGVGFVAFMPITVWMTYNLIYFGNPLVDSSIFGSPNISIAIGAWDFMSQLPFWQHTLFNYVGLIGWSHDGTLRWLQISGFPLRFFMGTILFTCLIVPFSSITQHRSSLREYLILLFPAFALAIYVAHAEPQLTAASWTCAGIFVALMWSCLVHVRRAWHGETHAVMLVSASVCAIFFSYLYFSHLWHGYSGGLQASHGRYIYPVLPFFVLVLAWPWRSPLLTRFALTGAIFSMAVGDSFYLHQVFKFYGQIH
jgi:preprotein translocase subunit SecG